MGTIEREQLIEAVGVQATNEIQELHNLVDEIHEFLNVIRVAHVHGYKLRAIQPPLIKPP